MSVFIEFIANMLEQPALVPGLSEESYQSNTQPFLASKTGVLGDSGILSPTFITCYLIWTFANYHNQLLTPKMIKMLARLGKIDCRILSLKKLTLNDPSLPEMRTILLKERWGIMQFMQVPENITDISIYFSNNAYVPPVIAQATPKTVTKSYSSGEVSASADADTSQNPVQMERPFEAERSSDEQFSDWSRLIGRQAM